MKAEIISIGTELLLGDILNTNAQYISKRLAELGIFVYYQTVLGDNPERIMSAYNLAFSRADLVITSGGLGPTQDDLTKEIAAKYFNKKLILDEDSLEQIKERFLKSNRVMSENNIKQAMMPENSIILVNPNGTAPGCLIEDTGRTMILMPGPPKEMKAMFEESVVPHLQKFTDGKLVSKTLRVSGIAESYLATQVGDLIDNGINPTVAPYANEFECTLRITAKASSEEEANKLIRPVEDEIRNRLGEYIYGEGENPLEFVLGETLVKNHLTVSTAESCTGGLLAGTLLNYPGISASFLEGVVTYTDESKMKRLGVKLETLEKFGAVSHETAEEMAVGIALQAGTNIGISTTGITGPNGATAEKPLGLVCIGICVNGKVKSKELVLLGSRDSIRNKTIREALNFLRLELGGYEKK
ncbi:MAG TPA: competence/damage-inducible protein A [Epulopiscium sp.]|nr:competence/damage-inducible protein A [Candidatus Epulonipiscium sp.]